jgi:hypothetical protein
VIVQFRLSYSAIWIGLVRLLAISNLAKCRIKNFETKRGTKCLRLSSRW